MEDTIIVIKPCKVERRLSALILRIRMISPTTKKKEKQEKDEERRRKKEKEGERGKKKYHGKKKTLKSVWTY